MIDREKVKKGLETCYSTQEKCEDCPYHDLPDEQNCNDTLGLDALALLKEQEEQIKNRDESLEKAREEIKWLRGMLKEQKPIQMKISEDYGFMKFGECPKCKSFINNRYFPKSCGCGQEVKWE